MVGSSSCIDGVEYCWTVLGTTGGTATVSACHRVLFLVT